jgi:2-pyrone-4,6-dicarboxylate lactonase
VRVDGHVHLWDLRAAATPPPYALPTAHAPVEQLLAHMRDEQIDRAVLVQPQLHGSDHRLLLAELARHPERFVGFGLVDADADDPQKPAREVSRLAGLGLAGVRVHLLNGGGRHVRDVAAAAARCGLALELHVDEAAWTRVPSVIEAAGDALVVIDHLGRPQDPAAASGPSFLREVARHPNVVVKLAAIDVVSCEPFPHRDVQPLIAAAVDALGPTRLLWGSNFPWCRGDRYGAGARAIEALGVLDGAALEAVLGTTADRLFFAADTQAVG